MSLNPFQEILKLTHVVNQLKSLNKTVKLNIENANMLTSLMESFFNYIIESISDVINSSKKNGKELIENMLVVELIKDLESILNRTKDLFIENQEQISSSKKFCNKKNKI